MEDNKIEKYPITGVALGPGDPELITLKAYKILEEADVVYYAASKIEDENITSFSKQILDVYKLKALCKPLLFPMSGQNRKQFYSEAYKILKADQAIGLRVVMAVEGDLGFYSTFGYIMKLAKSEDVEIKAIPGVPAFIAAGAQAALPIVDGNHSFLVLARPKSFNDIQTEINTDKAVVVMKMKVLTGWYQFLKNCNREFIYIEKAGTPDEFITSNANDLNDRIIPYFSLVIFPGIE